MTVCAPSTRSFPDWVALGAKTTHDNNQLVDLADIVFLCMKPYQYESAMKAVKFSPSSARPSKLFVSTLSGVPLTTLAEVSTNLPKFDHES